MSKGNNNIENKSDEKFIIMQASIDANKKQMKANKQDSGDKMTKFTE